MPRYIDAAGLCGDLLNRWHTAEKAKEQLITDVMTDIVVPIVVSQPTADVVETGKITSVITHLRSNRDSNLTRYTSNEGKESHIIISQKDRGYFQALDDIEETFLKKEKTDEAEHISQPINIEK